MLAVAVTVAAVLAPGRVLAATTAWVDTGGDCLVLRSAPGLSASSLDCLDHGTELLLLAGTQPLDGFTWQQVEHAGDVGWVANFYITTDPSEVQAIAEPATPETGGLLVPPAGGLTMGVTTETDPATLAAQQPYGVAGVWSLDVASQELRQYLPGAPAFVNTLSSIPAGGVVSVRREGELTTVGAPPEASLTVAGVPNELGTPPVGGITQGVSGTTDPKFLVQAQPFEVQSVAYFHVGSQQWLVYLPGAPDYVQSLQQGQLRVDSVVSLTRAPDVVAESAPDQPPAEPANSFESTITYYYCVPGSNPAGIGDGGGYCGGMANGQVVHDGAAACAPGKLGQRFTIAGDPTGRTYTCEDTGGAVLGDHRDIWFQNSDDGYAWWLVVGSVATVTVVPD